VGGAQAALYVVLYLVMVLQGDSRNPLGRRHAPTDQKVGGSNPSECAAQRSNHPCQSAACSSRGSQMVTAENLLRTNRPTEVLKGAHQA